MSAPRTILTVNVGSSSLKVSIHSPVFSSPLLGSFQRLGSAACAWKLEIPDGPPVSGQGLIQSATKTLDLLVKWIARLDVTPSAVAHRIVHGGAELTCHCLVTDEAVGKLQAVKALAPEHVPAELDLLAALRARFAEIPHFFCFDTVFHRTLAEEAYTFPLPEKITTRGVRRYGFHGLSYEYLVEWLRARGESGGRSILAHLGNGCSLAAVRDGQSVDTTMGFTPAGGLAMGTRCGDLDPGIFRFLQRELGLDALAIDHQVNHESGLLGVSGVSADVRDLLAKKETHPRAALALRIFCRTARKHLCALAGVLGGVDRVVFTGGIGEHAAEIRAGIVADLEFIGLRLDPAANAAAQTMISAPDSAAQIFIVPANEEAAMARIAEQLLLNLNPHATIP